MQGTVAIVAGTAYGLAQRPASAARTDEAPPQTTSEVPERQAADETDAGQLADELMARTAGA